MSLLSTGFKLGKFEIDKRYMKSKAEIDAMGSADGYPSVFPMWCKDDGNIYILQKVEGGDTTVTPLSSITGDEAEVVTVPTYDPATGVLSFAYERMSDQLESVTVNLVTAEQMEAVTTRLNMLESQVATLQAAINGSGGTSGGYDPGTGGEPSNPGSDPGTSGGGTTPDPDHVYTQEELEEMEIDDILVLAIARDYDIQSTEKDDIIQEFLTLQNTPAAPHIYTEEELNEMEVEEILAIAEEREYNITDTEKEDVIAAFLAAQNA